MMVFKECMDINILLYPRLVTVGVCVYVTSTA